MLFMLYYFIDIGSNIFMYVSGLLYKFLRCPFAYITVAGSQVVCMGGVLVFGKAAFMDGNTLITAIYFYTRWRKKHFYFFTDKAVRYAIIMCIRPQAYIAVFHDCNEGLLFKLIRVFGKRLQSASFYLFKLKPAAVVPSLKQCIVMGFQRLFYGGINAG